MPLFSQSIINFDHDLFGWGELHHQQAFYRLQPKRMRTGLWHAKQKSEAALEIQVLLRDTPLTSQPHSSFQAHLLPSDMNFPSFANLHKPHAFPPCVLAPAAPPVTPSPSLDVCIQCIRDVSVAWCTGSKLLAGFLCLPQRALPDTPLSSAPQRCPLQSGQPVHCP